MKTKKNHLTVLVASLALLIVGLSVPAALYAQTTLTGVNIPFNFFVGEQRFAPGAYTVRVTGEYIRLADASGHTAFVLTNRVAKTNWRDIKGGLLVFNQYDNAYFLTQVWREGYSNGNQLIKSTMEVQTAKNSTTNAPIALSASR